MKKIKIILIVLLCFFVKAKAQTYTTVPSLKGIYVNNFNEILGDVTKENALLTYAKNNAFTYLGLYSLASIDLTNSTKKAQMAAFLKKARTTYYIPYIAAIGETYNFFKNEISPYNKSRSYANERFNVFNLEFEFWIKSSVQPGGIYATKYLVPQKYSTDTSGAFKFYKKQLKSIDSLAATQGALSETYVGWFNLGQGKFIATMADRILLHAYRTEPYSTYSYSKTRLSYLASTGRVVTVSPIFSSESEFMGPWINSGHTPREAYEIYRNNFYAETATWKSKIRISGYQWFKYSLMPKTTRLAAVEEDSVEVVDLIKPTEIVKPLSDFSLYPNPSKGQVNLRFNPGTNKLINIRVITLTGQVIKDRKVDISTTDSFVDTPFDLSTEAKGLYLIQIEAEGTTFTEKVLLE